MVALYFSLTFFLLDRYHQTHPEFLDADAHQLLLDLEAVALAMLRDGVA